MSPRGKLMENVIIGKDCAEYISLPPFMSTTEQDVPKGG